MKILISGAHGFIGGALAKSLEQDGHEVLSLSRKKASGDRAKNLQWDPAAKSFPEREREKLSGIEAAVHLAGENIFGRWTPDKKCRILESRVQSTLLLSEALAKLPRPPRVLISASAVGYYGDRAEEILLEKSTSGNGFLAEVCREWEAATQPAQDAGIRVVHMRFGVVLDRSGGALAKLLLPFRLGLGGPLGSGKQFFSWVSLEDAVGALRFSLENEALSGAVNVASTGIVTNRTFTQTLAKVLRRPAILPVPALALRLVFGKESANQTMLASQRAIPGKLLSNGFEFRHPELEAALRELLEKE